MFGEQDVLVYQEPPAAMFGEQDVLVYQEAVLGRRGQRLAACCPAPRAFLQPSLATHSGHYLRLLHGQNHSPPMPAFCGDGGGIGGGGGGSTGISSVTSRRMPEQSVQRCRISPGYELSTDLAERQVACLERRYGGRRARLAATTIQRAYRRHALSKKFQAIALSAKTERRLSRRFDVGSGGWESLTTDLTSPVSPSTPLENGLGYGSYSCLSDTTFLSELCGPRRGRCASPQLTENGHGAQLFQSGDARSVRGVGGGGGAPTGSPPCRSSPATSATRRLETASSGSESSLSSAGPVSTSSPLLLRRRSQRSSSRSSGGQRSLSGGQRSLSGGQRSLPRSQSETATVSVERGHRGELRVGPQGSDTSRPAQNGHGQMSTQKVPEIVRKRQYRVGLNLFNTRPERGLDYLMARSFVDSEPQSVARFLITRKGLSKQMIGEYLGDLQSPFAAAVLEAFAQELDFYNMQPDVALRKFQTYFRLPGEAQKIERLMEVFGQRYCQCNHELVSTLRTPDTIFVLAFATIMLNTDLFTPNIKPEHKMKLEDFIKNLRGIDDGADVDPRLLAGIYERVRAQQFRPGADHVTPVLRVQQATTGKRPPLALPHRRLVCYCRLYEVPDVSKKERPGLHQREVFLFNDLMLITKILSKKKSSMTYSCRQSLTLAGLSISAFDLPYYPFGIRLSQRVDGKVLLTFNARNEHDRTKFCEDLRESILEMDEMEALRIDAGLERQRSAAARASCWSSENRDSGVADVEADGSDGSSKAGGMRRAALSNSLLDVSAAGRQQRRGSVGSLDSGMSVSFQSGSTASAQTGSPPTQPAANGRGKRH